MVFMGLFQLDDEPNLYAKWLFHQPFKNACSEFQVMRNLNTFESPECPDTNGQGPHNWAAPQGRRGDTWQKGQNGIHTFDGRNPANQLIW